LVGLHAKLYVADDGWNAHVWTGSANATSAGFDRNVELLVELIGKRSLCGVEAILGEPASGTKKRTACLADLLKPYSYSQASPKDREKLDFEREGDRLAQLLAKATPIARCTATTDTTDSFAISIIGAQTLTSAIPNQCELRARPVSLPQVSARPIDLKQKTWVHFNSVSYPALTSFFAFELISLTKDLRHQFVLTIPLVGAPEDRREYVLRHLLSDPDRVMRFLLLLLMDHRARDFSQWFADPTKVDGAQPWIHSMFESTLFESMVRALHRDPGRIDQVAHVIDDLRKSADGIALLPNGLDEIWQPIWATRQQQLEKQIQSQARKGP
jgi:hypothetical protein